MDTASTNTDVVNSRVIRIMRQNFANYRMMNAFDDYALIFCQLRALFPRPCVTYFLYLKIKKPAKLIHTSENDYPAGINKKSTFKNSQITAVVL